MKKYFLIFCILVSFFIGFFTSELSPRQVQVAYPAYNQEKNLHGVTIVSCIDNLMGCFFQRETTAMIDDADWDMFGPKKY